MATQQEVAQKLSAAIAQLDVIKTQVQSLKDAAANNAGDAISELADAADSLAADVQSLADILSGTTPVTPVPADGGAVPPVDVPVDATPVASTTAVGVDVDGNPIDANGNRV